MMKLNSKVGTVLVFRKSLAALALATALSLPLVFNSAHAAGETQAPSAAPTISVITAVKAELHETLVVTGNIQAREEVLVTPEIEGLMITDFMVEEGDTVTKDQPLLHLDGRLIDIQLKQNDAALARNDAAIAQAESQIAQAQIAVDRTQNDWNRTKQLTAQKIVTAQAADNSKAAYDTAVAQLQSAKLAIQAAKADKVSTSAQRDQLLLSKQRTEITAPVAGLISSRTAQIGAIASASKPSLYTIVQDGDVKLVADVAEGDLPKLQIGQKVKVEISGRPEQIDGEIRLMSPQVDSATRLGKVHIALAKGSKIPTGVFGRGIVEVASSAGLTLPLTAVNFSADGNTIQIVKDGKVEVRKVTTGLVSQGKVEILNGLTAGEDVVARAGTFVRDGDVVTPVKLSTAGQ